MNALHWDNKEKCWRDCVTEKIIWKNMKRIN